MCLPYVLPMFLLTQGSPLRDVLNFKLLFVERFLKIGQKEKTGFTFCVISCIVFLNRVGDPALSAVGTGSCPMDEGIYFHDGVTAPAAHI